MEKKLTRELLADCYKRGMLPPEVAAKAGCTPAHVRAQTDLYGLRPELDRVRADRAVVRAAQKAEREAAKEAAKDARKRAQLRNEREQWLETCRANYAKYEPVVSAQETGDRSIHRTARAAWVASEDKCRSDGTPNAELMVWLREFIADTGIRHKFAHGKWGAWAKDKPHVRLKTANQVRWRVIFDTRLQDLFDGGAE